MWHDTWRNFIKFFGLGCLGTGIEIYLDIFLNRAARQYPAMVYLVKIHTTPNYWSRCFCGTIPHAHLFIHLVT
jgi:hypothetical protein